MAGALPTGTVAFLFTDIEGSTRLARARPLEFPVLLERHRTLLRAAFSEGAEVDTAGDAFFVAFARVADAIRAAAAAQRSLAGEPWPEAAEVRVRMGVHVGAADLIGSNYVGAEVHRAARVCAAAHGGQVLVSSAAAGLCEEPGEDLALELLGDYRLKDFDAPQPLYQLTVGGLRTEFPPPRTAEARVVALPVEVTSFVGRERDVVELIEFVLAHRLVTLTGPGGSGKTRLGLRVARSLAPRFRGPVAFLPLARIDDEAAAVGVLARALELEGAVTGWDAAIAALRSQNALIVWDNAEHLPGLASRIELLRDGCDRLHCLVTSRSPLGVAGEQLYPVDPLDTESAVALLVDRALQFQPHFDVAVAEGDLQDVAKRLDGLPLALELAAARLRSLPANAVVDRLDRQLDLLADTAGGHVERHQTIRGALRWSYDLVEPHDQQLFLRLAVFAGPARLEAIAHVAECDEMEALDGLTRLIDASLVRLEAGPEPRYWMLEPVRQFAAERLANSPHESHARRRMLNWYLETATSLGLGWPSLRTFLDERENLLRAYGYSAELGDWETGVALAYLTAGAFEVSGTSALLSPWADEAEQHRDGLSPVGRAKLVALPVPNDRTQHQQAVLWLDTARASGDLSLVRSALIFMADTCVLDGDLDAATAAITEAAAVEARTLFDVYIQKIQACIAEARGQPADALWAEAERRARAGDEIPLVGTLWFSANACLARGDSARALALLQEALSAVQSWESQAASELGLRYLAGVSATLEDDRERAATHLHRALVLFERVGTWNLFIELPPLILATATLLAQAGRTDPAAALFAWAEPQLELPSSDPFATVAQRDVVVLPLLVQVETDLILQALRGHDTPPEQLDRDQVLRLALDEIAAVRAETQPTQRYD